jgi:predicted xylose isomerase-like sugar epimerase
MVAFSALALGLLVGCAAAHPGESHSAAHLKRELVARDNAAAVGARSLAACSSSTASQALKARSIKRRAEAVKNIREKRGITTGEYPPLTFSNGKSGRG